MIAVTGSVDLRAPVLNALLEVTSRSPLLLRLANRAIEDGLVGGGDTNAVGEDLLRRIRAGGLAAIDDLAGEVDQGDIHDPHQRRRAVSATLLASTALLSTSEGIRLTELTVFVEGELIPLDIEYATLPVNQCEFL